MAAASVTTKLFSLFETNSTITTTVNLHSFRTLQFPIKPIFPPTLRLRRYNSSSVSVITEETTTGDLQQHPWPEWVTFVDRLKSKGYICQEADGTDVSVYKDMTILKEACLSFGRDRFDLFKSLSMQDIHTLVDKGCPNVNRKTVNSGKRLRAHLQLDEGDVCGVCVYRGSCDRAYVTLKDTESIARTVDVVRVLLNYALDPAVDSDNKPSGAEVVEASAKKLLLELTELSDTKIDPELQKPAVTVARKAQSFESTERDLSQNVEMKKGDWMCPKCDFMNFSRNARCLKCKTKHPLDEPRAKVVFVREETFEGPKRVGTKHVEMKKGDWNCPQCNFMNFWRNVQCLKCKTQGPRGAGANDVEMKKGDWNCPRCQFMNFASNSKCKRCREQRPKRQLNPGEWECTSCDFLNYSGNVVCRKCNGERPKDAEAEYQEHTWRRT